MKHSDVYVGLRVFVSGEGYAGMPLLHGKEGTIVCLDDDFDDYLGVGVEFDEPFEDGHNCNGAGRDGYCRYGSYFDLDIIDEPLSLDCIKFSFDDFMNGVQ